METSSKCPSCSNTYFEAVKESPINFTIKLIFVRCTSCKAVVGVVDYYNVGRLIKDLASELEIDLDDHARI